jgi:predicted Rossmann-fold nucleotide-binding protein
MQAANEGAAEGDEHDRIRSVGIRVDLPFEQGANPFVEQAYEHKTFFTRLHHFVLASDAYVVAPGGIGTTLELMMVWQLLQVRHVRQTPLILVGGMWAELVDWARRNLLAPDPPLAGPEDIAIPVCVETADEAIRALREHHDRWASGQAGAAAT